jgi:tetratricopeptide (TPR) repeat protein
MKISVVRCVVFLLFVFGWLCFFETRVKAQGESSASTQPEMVELRDADSRFKDRDIDGALKCLEDAAKKNTDLPPPEVMMAERFLKVNSVPGYILWLEKAVVKHPTDPEAYVDKAELDLRNGQFTEAELLYQKATELMPNFAASKKRKDALLPQIADGMARISEFREDWPTAQKRLEDWLKLEPKNAEALQRLGRVLFKLKKPSEALGKLREAKAAKSDILTPEAQLAGLYREYGDKENAKKWTNLALKAAPNEELTWLFAAEMAMYLEQYDEAQSRAAKAMELNPSSLVAKLLRGNIALFQKDYLGAEKYFQAAHLQSPGTFAATNNLAIALVEQKDESKKRKALEYAQDNWQRYRQSQQYASEAASTLGWVLYKVDPRNIDNADRFLQAALSSGNFNADTAYYAAVVAAQRGRKEEAKRLLEAILKTTRPFTMKSEAKLLLEQLSR